MRSLHARWRWSHAPRQDKTGRTVQLPVPSKAKFTHFMFYVYYYMEILVTLDAFRGYPHPSTLAPQPSIRVRFLCGQHAAGWRGLSQIPRRRSAEPPPSANTPVSRYERPFGQHAAPGRSVSSRSRSVHLDFVRSLPIPTPIGDRGRSSAPALLVSQRSFHTKAMECCGFIGAAWGQTLPVDPEQRRLKRRRGCRSRLAARWACRAHRARSGACRRGSPSPS